ncbi:MAG: hypothetical protein ABI867_26470 [Kofleriaceae bacterium]
MLIIVSILAGLAVVFLVVPAIVFRVAAPKLNARVAKVYASEAIVFSDHRASNFGLESKGSTQQRGNGALVLTANELHFFQLIPKSDFRISLGEIKKVDAVRTHLGKTVGRKLLYVSFTVEGGEDAVAFSVRDIDAWLVKLAGTPAQNVK